MTGRPALAGGRPHPRSQAPRPRPESPGRAARLRRALASLQLAWARAVRGPASLQRVWARAVRGLASHQRAWAWAVRVPSGRAAQPADPRQVADRPRAEPGAEPARLLHRPRPRGMAVRPESALAPELQEPRARASERRPEPAQGSAPRPRAGSHRPVRSSPCLRSRPDQSARRPSGRSPRALPVPPGLQASGNVVRWSRSRPACEN